MGLISLAGMWLELSLTHLFGLLFFYNYVFVILTVAVLGISIGAALVHQWGARFRHSWAHPVVAVSVAALLVAALEILTVEIVTVQTVSVDGRVLLTVLALLPQIGIGITLASIFMMRAPAALWLYGADLVGAGLGALLAILLFNLMGALATLPLVAVVLGVAGLLLWPSSHPRPPRWQVALAAASVIGAAALAFWQPTIDMSKLATPKPLTRFLQDAPGAQTVYSEWDAFARTDVVASPALPNQRQLFVDGAAGSVMPDFPQDVDAQGKLMAEIGYFPFRTHPERVFVVGPGGGRDVLYALLAGSSTIAGAEIAPGVVRAVHHFAQANGDLYGRPEVEIVVDDGRRVLQQRDEQFDLIYLSEVVSLAAEFGSLVLAENTIYTIEAFQEYVQRLAPGGRIALKLYDELTLTRAFVTAIAALNQMGVDEATATRHLVVLLDPTILSAQTPLRSPLLLIYKSSLTVEAAAALLAEVERAGLTPLFIPHVYEHPPLSTLATGETTVAQMIARFNRADISPTTDSRPFFFEFRRGLPETMRQLLLVLGGAMLVGIAFLVYRQRHYRQHQFAMSYWPFAGYFALLGCGFLAAELAVLHYLTLLLGHPTTALAVGLGTILIAAGCGSLIAARLPIPARRLVMGSGVFAALLLFAAPVLLPPLINALHPVTAPVRVASAIAITAPIFLLLGMPFPLGLQLAAARLGAQMTPLAWAINGLTSTLGATGAMALALLWGFDTVMLAVALLYLLVVLLTWRGLRA